MYVLKVFYLFLYPMAQAIVEKTPGTNLCNVEFNHLCLEPAGSNSRMEESQGALRPDHVHRELPTQQSQAAPQCLTSSGQFEAPAPLRLHLCSGIPLL